MNVDIENFHSVYRSRCAEGPQGYSWTEASAAVSKGLSTERNRLGTSEVRRVTTGGRRHSAAEAHSAASRKRLATRRQSMQHYIAEESNLHERALEAVKSVTTPSKTETETETDPKEKEIIADVLRGFLLENAALTGSEQVFVFGVTRTITLQTR